MKTNEMTIIKAIKVVLNGFSTGATIDEIYNGIIEKNLYTFNAKNPKGVVTGEIRRHCYSLDFPTASPVKHFYIVNMDHGKPHYGIFNDQTDVAFASKSKIKDTKTDELPEEKVENTINAYNLMIKEKLMQKILLNEPSFFEHLVVDLLLKMGYGYDETAGTIIGRSHDGGIDGIISEDKLGLDQIYIQAKRYSKGNSVGRKELQAFVGAMSGVEKGVFITTSTFTSEAKDYIERIQQKHVKLIDGSTLLNYMLKYEIGIQALKEYKIFRIDEDYFV